MPKKPTRAERSGRAGTRAQRPAAAGSRGSARSRIDSVERTLDIVGDRWIFLILREAFFGVRGYDEFRTRLGIATNVLADRLRRLVDHGVFTRGVSTEDARRVEYRLTERGRDLYGVCLALLRWGDRWVSDEAGPPLALTHRPCGRRLDPVVCCAACGAEVHAREVDYAPAAPSNARARPSRESRRR